MKTRLPRLPFALLAAMTLFSFGGPVAIGYALRGGDRPNWPPDRPVEWAVLVGVSAAVVALMGACLSLALLHRKAPARPEPPGGPDGARP